MKNIEIRKGLREALWSASDFVGALKAETRSPHSKAAAPQLKSCGLSVGLLFAVASAPAPQAAAVPNIVIFFSDDHTQQAVSAYQDLPGAPARNQLFKNWAPLQTPNIDRLAANGAIFTKSFVSNSICKPSRANLLTGLHSHANGQTTNAGTFNGDQQTLPKLLQAAGYDTALFGKWHLTSEPTGFTHYERLVGQGAYYSPVLRSTQPDGGTTDVTFSGLYVAEVIKDRATAWLQDRLDTSRSDPFFVMVNHKGTHRNWLPGPVERELETFRHVEWDYLAAKTPNTHPDTPQDWTPAAPPQPANYGDYLANYPTRADGARLQEMEVATHILLPYDLKLASSTFGGGEYDEVRAWWTAKEASLTAAQRDDYLYQRYVKDYAMTGQSVDRSVGEVLDFLEANDLDHNTIIIYASDQGFYLGEHGWFDKRWMYEESLSTPLLMQWKDASGNALVTPGSQVDEMVQVLDYAPTLLEAAGVTGFTAMHGESFLGFTTTPTGDEPATWRDSLYYHYYAGDEGHNVKRHYGVRDGRYKLIHHYEVGQWELFDLQDDPAEMNNLLYNPSSGVIDNPTNGVNGDPAFQQLVIDLMVDLAAHRSAVTDTTGPGFSIPGISIPDISIPVIIIDEDYTNDSYSSNGSFEYDAAGVQLTGDYVTPGLWLPGSSGLGSAGNYGSQITQARDNVAAVGDYALVIGGGGPADDVSGGVLNTGYAVQSGDIFTLSYAFDPLVGWGSPEGLDIILFTSDDNTMTGNKTLLWSSLNQHNGIDTAFIYYNYDTSAIIIDGASAHVGQSLFIEFNGTTTANNIDAFAGFARVDDVQLSVTAAPPSTPGTLFYGK
jgi:arylsulfatase A-like enzyme